MRRHIQQWRPCSSKGQACSHHKRCGSVCCSGDVITTVRASHSQDAHSTSARPTPAPLPTSTHNVRAHVMHTASGLDLKWMLMMVLIKERHEVTRETMMTQDALREALLSHQQNSTKCPLHAHNSPHFDMHGNGMGCCKCERGCTHVHMLVATLQRREAGQGKGATPPASSTHPNLGGDHSAPVLVTAAVAMAKGTDHAGKRNPQADGLLERCKRIDVGGQAGVCTAAHNSRTACSVRPAQ
jgi:hypothetical protein